MIIPFQDYWEACPFNNKLIVGKQLDNAQITPRP